MADQTSSIPQQAVEDAARALAVTPWDRAPEGLKSMIRQQAERVLLAALSGRQVVELPSPDATDNEGDPLWDLGGNEVVIAYVDTSGHPILRLPDGDDVAPEWAEMYAAVLLAAVRDSRQLAAEGTVRVCPKCGQNVEALPRGRACDDCVASYTPPTTESGEAHG